uniref:Glycoside hydrolase n=1 Tax=Strongyloides papillosus TaxID=174720 RepID=A0A0N5BT77_STREA
MLNKVLTIFLLLSTVFVSTNAEYAYAIDVKGSFSVSQFRCIKLSNYSAIFTQIYSPINGGSVDIYGSKNVVFANQVGLGTEAYINPSPQSIKRSYIQFDEAYNQLISAGIKVRTIWLKVTKPLLWKQNSSYNVDFIKGMITRARSRGVTLGIFTNWYDWDQITGSTTTFQQYNLPLWYWDVYGFGSGAESPANFDDFRSFGSFSYIKAKEYALIEWFCSAVISKVVYEKSDSSLELISNKNTTQPIAGNAIF